MSVREIHTNVSITAFCYLNACMYCFVKAYNTPYMKIWNAKINCISYRRSIASYWEMHFPNGYLFYLLRFNDVYQSHGLFTSARGHGFFLDCNTMVTHQILTATQGAGFRCSIGNDRLHIGWMVILKKEISVSFKKYSSIKIKMLERLKMISN